MTIYEILDNNAAPGLYRCVDNELVVGQLQSWNQDFEIWTPICKLCKNGPLYAQEIYCNPCKGWPKE